MKKSIAETYIENENTNELNIDDIVLQSNNRNNFLFTDGSILILSEDEKRHSNPSVEVELFLEDENEIENPKLCIVKNQFVGGKSKDEFMASVIYLDANLNGAVSFRNDENENESRKLSTEESVEKLSLLNINPKSVMDGLNNYNEIQQIVKNKYNQFIGKIQEQNKPSKISSPKNDSNKRKNRPS